MKFICSACNKEISFGEACSCNKVVSNFLDGIWHIGEDFFMDHDCSIEIEKKIISKKIDPWEKDSFIQKKFIEKYILPLIDKLILSKKNVNSILAAGCGTGFEVEVLNILGFDAYGYDPGSRHAAWLKRKNCEGRLIHCLDKNLPFAKGTFDLILSQQVIEHVGVVDDTMIPKKNCDEIRFNFCQNLISYVKPGGSLQIATPNRHFLIDPGHSPNFGKFRLHSPFDKFLVSYSDMKRYFYPHKVKPLTPLGYYTGTSFSNENKIGHIFNKYLEIIDKYKFLLNSPLNPLCSVLVEKNL